MVKIVWIAMFWSWVFCEQSSKCIRWNFMSISNSVISKSINQIVANHTFIHLLFLLKWATKTVFEFKQLECTPFSRGILLILEGTKKRQPKNNFLSDESRLSFTLTILRKTYLTFIPISSGLSTIFTWVLNIFW